MKEIWIQIDIIRSCYSSVKNVRTPAGQAWWLRRIASLATTLSAMATAEADKLESGK